MPIDGFFVHHLVNELKPIVDKALIGKIYQPSKMRLYYKLEITLLTINYILMLI